MHWGLYEVSDTAQLLWHINEIIETKYKCIKWYIDKGLCKNTTAQKG